MYHLEPTLPPFNRLLNLSISEGDCMPYLMINGTSGEVYTSTILDRDGHLNLRQNGWCNLTIKVCSMFYISLLKWQSFQCTAKHIYIHVLLHVLFSSFKIGMVSESYCEFIVLGLHIYKPSKLQYKIKLILLKKGSK